MKSWTVLIVITATRYATSSVQWYLCVRSHDTVNRYQYASTGEQVKMSAKIHAGPKAATKTMEVQMVMRRPRDNTEEVRRR